MRKEKLESVKAVFSVLHLLKENMKSLETHQNDTHKTLESVSQNRTSESRVEYIF